MSARFRVLGTLDVVLPDRPVPLPACHGRVVPADLPLRANEIVSVDQFTRWLWTTRHRTRTARSTPST